MDPTPAATAPDALRASLERALAGRYRIVRLLGRGGMGAVFLAREESLERLVAIKVLPSGREDDSESRERFRREARTAARLAHPNIVPLHGFDEVDGMMYLAMGYVNGESLAAHLKRDGKLPAGEARRILADVAEALDYAHRRGVIHRDVKPDNILIDDETGRALLADFGIAKALEGGEQMTRAGLIVGTPLYMSPEQARGEELDGRSDLYSLGAVGHAMLSGRAPFEGGTPQEAIVKRLTQEAPPIKAPDLPTDLGEAVNRCLARQRDRRFPDARAFRQAIAPSALEEDELPEPLAALDGKVAWLAVLVVALSLTLLQLLGHVVEHDYRRARQQMVRPGAFPLVAGLGLLSLLAMQGPMLTAAAGAARRRGFSRAQIAGAFFRQPRWWPCFWYPRRWRRKDDIWDRLPAPFRHLRMLVSIVVADLLFFIGLTSMIRVMNFLDQTTLRRFEAAGLKLVFLRDGIVVATVFSLATASFLAAVAILVLFRCARLLRSHGLETYELRRISRAFLFGPTADRALWKKPELARLLLPLRAPAGILKPPASPREYPEAMARLLAGPSGVAGQTADRAVAAARGLAAALAGVDEHLVRLNRGFDSKEVERHDERLAALGPEDPSDDEERNEMRRLFSKQRELLRHYEARLEQTRAHRERALRLLEELWRRAQAAARPGHEQLLATAVAEAEAFVIDVASPADSTGSNTATRVRPAAAG